MSSECGPRYLRVKRKSEEEPCYSSRQYKRCKYIASVKTNLLQDVLKVINNQNISDSDIVDVNQNVEEETNDEFTGIPPEEEETNFRGFVYDIYCLQDLDNNLYSVDEEEEEGTDDTDSNDENNPKNDYPDDADYDYGEINYYRDWEYEDEYKLEEKFGAVAMKGKENNDSSSEDSLSRNCDDEEDDEEDEYLDPDKMPVPFAPPLKKTEGKKSD